MRVKKNPAKKRTSDKNEEAAVKEVPEEMKHEIRRASDRFLFNVDQIEQKFCRSTSGMVLNLETDEYEFDPEQCSAQSDEELIKLIKRQKDCLSERSFGSALLSTPAPDPEEKNAQKLERWKAMNQNFETTYGLPSKANDENTCKSLVPVGRPKQIEFDKLDVSRVRMSMIERYQTMGRVLGREDLRLLKNTVLQNVQWALTVPPPSSAIPFTFSSALPGSSFDSDPPKKKKFKMLQITNQ